ncbi:hypothetical protein Ancab_002952 [Ancistrocladus abbreviatus]
MLLLNLLNHGRLCQHGILKDVWFSPSGPVAHLVEVALLTFSRHAFWLSATSAVYIPMSVHQAVADLCSASTSCSEVRTAFPRTVGERACARKMFHVL